MAVFEPSTQIYVGHVDWDNSYRNVRLWADAASQEAGIRAMLEPSAITPSQYTYIRKDGILRIMLNAERLYPYNYCMYKNANYGDKWFYCFISSCTYVNENMSELKLVTDVMQTWAFDYKLKECVIEREHVFNDKVGAHTVPEPQMDFATAYIDAQAAGGTQETMKVVVQTNAAPIQLTTPVAEIYWSSESVVGGIYNNVYSGGKYYAFDQSDGSHDSQVYQWLKVLSSAGGTGGVSNIFMFPSDFLPPVGSDHGVEENTQPKTLQYTLEVPTSPLGYTPRNNKLLTYPYTFCRVDVPGTGHNDYRFEWFADGTAHFDVMCPLDADAQIMAFPVNYRNSGGRSYQDGFYAPYTTKLSWVNSAYETWSAQNAMSNALSIALALVPMTRGLKGMEALSAATARQTTVQAGTELSRYRMPWLSGASGEAGTAAASAATQMAMAENRALVASGAVPLAQLASEAYRMAITPDTMCGSSAGNSLYAVGAKMMYLRRMCPTVEYMRVIDDYFDRYGYEVDYVGTPAKYTRLSWNYIKTAGSCVYGKVPNNDARVIESVYDAGVTFWHTDDIGNYSLDNPPLQF